MEGVGGGVNVRASASNGDRAARERRAAGGTDRSDVGVRRGPSPTHPRASHAWWQCRSGGRGCRREPCSA